jgi:phosphoglycolate phosphatase-like HAD superfamily hydrolase
MKAVLFDIDGTILSTGGAGRASFLEAAEKIFGATGHMESVDFRGKPDSQILAESFQNAGLSMEEITEKTPVFKKEYFAILRERILRHDCLLMPGTRELLDALYADRNIILCLLTGNFRDGAYIKIGHFELERYFSMGVFGDDAVRRTEMPPIARRRIRELHGIDLSFDRIIIIGDTVHDIECARSSGAVSIAVGTGWTDRDTLMTMKPDHYLDDLSDTRKVLDLIGTI